MLQQYITEVLFRQQTCTVPQVGTFTIQHIPAQFSMADQSLTPPRQQVQFDTRWEDDGSLLRWISRKENLLEPVASLKLDKYLQQFRDALAAGEPLDLPGIGSLRIDPLGQLRFTPQELPDAWQPIALEQVIRSEATPRVLQGTTEVENQVVVEHTGAVYEEPESQGRFRWWWVVLPLVLIGAGVAGWMFKDQIVPPSAPKAEEKVAVAPSAPEQDSVVTAPIEPVAPVSDSISYYVIFQTYKVRENAERSLSKRHAWGYKDVVLFYSEDSTQFKMAVPYRTLRADTTAAKDSVSKRFMSKEISILY
ncbi:HU domain-containing protein [Chitinophaga deserti]|uniref:HU domain-containing protein n=1 Tax=Chitinophaga deserti TaxID=2164099 RepID=UPI000D6D9ABB|nr:hypothetical protein [Chitinophaga deserti]